MIDVEPIYQVVHDFTKHEESPLSWPLLKLASYSLKLLDNEGLVVFVCLLQRWITCRLIKLKELIEPLLVDNRVFVNLRVLLHEILAVSET